MKKSKEQVLREYIRREIMNLLEKKDTATTSGMAKVKDTSTHTDSKKENKPSTEKVTKDGKPASVTATAEVKTDDAKIEDKNIKDSEKDSELKDKGNTKETTEKYECEDYGIKLKVNGPSLASVNSLYMLGIIKKSLEGRGQYVQEVDIKLGPKKEEKTISN